MEKRPSKVCSQDRCYYLQTANAVLFAFLQWSSHKEGDMHHFGVLHQYIIKAHNVSKSTAPMAAPSLVACCHYI